MDTTNYNRMTVPQLRAALEALGYRAPTAMRKPQLIETLQFYRGQQAAGVIPQPPAPGIGTNYNNMTEEQLRNLIIQRGHPIANRRTAQFRTKADLIRFLQNLDRGVVPPMPIPPVSPVRLPSPQRPNVPIVPVTNVPPMDLDASIRRKLQNATFATYDFEWRGRAWYDREIPPAREIAGDFYISQRGTFGITMYIIEFLMTKVTPQYLLELVSILGFRNLTDTIDTYYNLLWYLNIANRPNGLTLTDAEKAYISGLDINQLINLLGPRYRGPRDKASLLFAVVSGKSTSRPEIADIPRYRLVSKYSPSVVWNLAKNYNVVDGENNLFSIYPPYVHVALQPETNVEKVMAIVTEANVDTLMAQMGIILPTDEIPVTPAEKVKYFTEEIQAYEPIFARAPGTLPPPVLTGRTRDQIANILSVYTLKEIVDAYEPVKTWKNRKRLIKIISEEPRGGAKWAWRHLWCSNDDTLNFIDLAPHGEMNKDDPNDPTLSYGVQRNYRCYQAAELDYSWQADEAGTIHFNVPDWNEGAIDPATNAPLIREFPTDSIRQLRTLLQNPPAGYKVGELARKVQYGLDALNNTTIIINRLRAEYNAKPADQQYIIRLYLAWLFIYGMWMRFWNGPGNPWPTRWVEGGGEGDLCEAARRDEHIFIQHSIYATIATTYEQYPGLKAWIEALPLLDYNFTTGEAAVATAGATNIKIVLDRIALGDFCMAHGSDLILKTSYYLIARILNLTTGAQFNEFINNMLTALLDIERQTVVYQLTLIKDRTKARERVATLEARRDVLNRPTPAQPPFDPTTVGKTGHTDPNLGWEIRFGDEGRR